MRRYVRSKLAPSTLSDWHYVRAYPFHGFGSRDIKKALGSIYEAVHDRQGYATGRTALYPPIEAWLTGNIGDRGVDWEYTDFGHQGVARVLNTQGTHQLRWLLRRTRTQRSGDC